MHHIGPPCGLPLGLSAAACMLQGVMDNNACADLPQDNIHKEYRDTGALWSMCWMNFWCSLYNSVYLFGFTRAGWDLLAFCRQHPEVSSHTVEQYASNHLICTCLLPSCYARASHP